MRVTVRWGRGAQGSLDEVGQRASPRLTDSISQTAAVGVTTSVARSKVGMTER